MSSFFRLLLGQSGGGGGGGSSTPDAILGSNLVAWYKKATGIYDAVVGGSLVSSDGTEVGRWEDQSGNGYHATRASAINSGHLQWRTGTTDRGSGTVQFQDITAYLNVPDGLRTTLQSAVAAEMWVRLKNAVDPGAPNGAWFFGGTNDCHFLYSDGHWYESFGSTTRRDCGNPTTDTSAAFCVVDVYSLTNDWQAFLNNTSLVSSGTNTFDTGSTLWRFGKSINNYFLGAWVSEIVFSKAKATGTQRNDMYTYLTT